MEFTYFTLVFDFMHHLQLGRNKGISLIQENLSKQNLE